MTSGFRIRTAKDADVHTPARSVAALVRSLNRKEAEEVESEISSSDDERDAAPGRRPSNLLTSPSTPVVTGRAERQEPLLSAQRSFLSTICRPHLADRGGTSTQRPSTQPARHAEGSLQALLGQSQPLQQQILQDTDPGAYQLTITAIVRRQNLWVVSCDSHSEQLPADLHLLVRSQIAEELECAVGQTLLVVRPWTHIEVSNSSVIIPACVGALGPAAEQ